MTSNDTTNTKFLPLVPVDGRPFFATSGLNTSGQRKSEDSNTASTSTPGGEGCKFLELTPDRKIEDVKGESQKGSASAEGGDKDMANVKGMVEK